MDGNTYIQPKEVVFIQNMEILFTNKLICQMIYKSFVLDEDLATNFASWRNQHDIVPPFKQLWIDEFEKLVRLKPVF